MAGTDLIENVILFTRLCERPSDELRRAGVKLETNTLAYTDLKNPELEETIEAVLLKHGIFYGKSETWIESEKLYEVLYEMEV